MTWIQWFDYNNLLLFKIINVHYFGTQQVNYQRWQTIVVIDEGGSNERKKSAFAIWRQGLSMLGKEPLNLL